MANYTLQELAEEMERGRKIIYPKMQVYSMHDFDTVIRHMRDYAGSFSEGTIRGVVDALIEVMKAWMPMGHTIKIDGLGVFSLTLGFNTDMPSEKEQPGNPKTSHRHVRIKGINFKPDPGLIGAMNKGTEFNRAAADVVVPKKNTLSREERISRAHALLERNGYMTLTDYAIATEQGRTSASKDLRQLVADATTGIAVRGSHSHKVWVKR